MENKSTSLTNGNGVKTRSAASSENANRIPPHHLNVLSMAASQVAFAGCRGEGRYVGELGDNASVLERINFFRDGTDKRQVLLDEDERRFSAQLAKHFFELSDDAGR